MANQYTQPHPPRLTPEQQALVVKWRGLAAKASMQIFGKFDEDAAAEGELGLCHAAAKFDPARKVSFVTYGTWWARAFVLRALITWRGGDLKIGTTLEERKVFYGMGRARRAIEATGETATNATIARYFGVEEQVVEGVAQRLLPPLQLDHQAEVSDRPLELPSPDPSPEDDASAGEAEALHAHVRAVIRTLPDRERLIVQARFLADEPITLAELGGHMGISRERVRQLEERALQTLRVRLAGMRRVA